MLAITEEFKRAIKASSRQLAAKAELFEGSSLVATYTHADAIKSITIERVGEDSKFFGFGVIHKANIKLIDIEREKNITTANHFKIYIGIKTNSAIEYATYTDLYVSEVHRDENTNELSITLYDKLQSATALYVSDLTLPYPYTIKSFVEACAAKLELSASIPELNAFNLEYENGANFEGTETLQEALTAAAEATQTIFYINANGALTFKRLDAQGEPALTITREDYITLDSSTNRRLQTICNATELGDNVSASTSLAGTTQYIRDNAFLELREDIGAIVENAIAEVGNMTINQFNCSWRGNPALEIGDKINLITKDNATVTSYLLNDSITYEGGLSESSEWNYAESTETESNPSTLGEVLKQTYARVDKANKQVELLVSEVSTNTNAITTLQLNTESITASVQNIETTTNEALEGLNTELNTITNKVNASVTAEDVQLQINSTLDNGVAKVTTSTGFTFDENGMTISKTGSEMTTTVDEDGMTIYRDNEEVLIADNEGVAAIDLHAKTYLIIGNNSRLEDFTRDGEDRTACFWIGGE
jgi:hypothetical protein